MSFCSGSKNLFECQQHYQHWEEMVYICQLAILFILIFELPGGLGLDSKTQEKMLASSYEGTWQISGDDKNQTIQYLPFSQRITNSGKAIIYFNSDSKKHDQISNVVVEFLMPDFYDQRMIRLVIDLSQPYDDGLERWESRQNCSYEIYDETLLAGQGSFQIYFIVDKEIVVIENLQSTTFLLINYWKNTINPKSALIFTFYAFVVFLAAKRNNSIDQTHIRHQVVPIILTLIIILVIAVTEIIIGFRSLFGEMSPEAFFTVSGFLNMGVLFQVCRFYGPRILKNNVIIFVSWGLGIAYLWFLLYFRHNYICLILNALIFLPEIIYHALRGQKIQADPKFYFILCSNQLYVLYFKACPANIFRESPNYLLGYCIFGLLFLQIVISVGQIYLGSRFFIPSVFLPVNHNYYNPTGIKDCLKVDGQCYVCLEQLQPSKKAGRKLMLTPCKHVFHAQCLEGWMLVKMKCPIDRSDLPPL